MKAVILAGGQGTRLRPYTIIIPKPLVPVGDKAVLEILIEKLKSFGIIDITLCINHLAHLIMSYFGDGSKFGVNIQYSLEDKSLSTIGPLKLIDDLPENFIVMNGDIITDLDFRKLYEYHIEKNSELTVATFEREIETNFGVIAKHLDNIIEFEEKPLIKVDVSMGIYVMNKEVLKYVPNDTFGFDDLILSLLKKGIEEGVTLKSYHHDGYWLDIGRPEDYEKANEVYYDMEDASI